MQVKTGANLAAQGANSAPIVSLPKKHAIIAKHSIFKYLDCSPKIWHAVCKIPYVEIKKFTIFLEMEVSYDD
jgi:hypothetical protein